MEKKRIHIHIPIYRIIVAILTIAAVLYIALFIYAFVRMMISGGLSAEELMERQMDGDRELTAVYESPVDSLQKLVAAVDDESGELILADIESFLIIDWLPVAKYPVVAEYVVVSTDGTVSEILADEDANPYYFPSPWYGLEMGGTIDAWRNAGRIDGPPEQWYYRMRCRYFPPGDVLPEEISEAAVLEHGLGEGQFVIWEEEMTGGGTNVGASGNERRAAAAGFRQARAFPLIIISDGGRDGKTLL